MKSIKIEVHSVIFSTFATQDYQAEMFLHDLRKEIDNIEKNTIIIVDLSQISLATSNFIEGSIGVLLKELRKENFTTKIRFKNPPNELKKFMN